MLRVAVVILNWNGQEFLEKFLPDVIKNTQNEDCAVVVVDNGSSDGSVAFLQNNYPEVRLIQFSKNYGFAGGYHKALTKIEAKYYCLLNSDVLVPEGWLNDLVDYMERYDNVSVCMPKVLKYGRENFFEYAGASGGFIDKYGFPFCRGRILNYPEEDMGQYDTNEHVFWATGAAMLVRSDDYHAVGGLDSDFFAHMEEIDLCWRLINHGKLVSVIPSSKVFHVGGGTLPNESSFKLFLNFRNSLFMLTKNLHIKDLLWILPVRLIMDAMAAFVYILQGKMSLAYSVFKAHAVYFTSFQRVIKKRKNMGGRQRIKNIESIYQGSIVFDYMLRKKRKFSKIFY